MKTPTFSLVTWFILSATLFAASPTRPDPIGHERLLAAWSHLKAAEGLARGGAV